MKTHNEIRQEQAAFALKQMTAGSEQVFREFFHGTFKLFADKAAEAKYEVETRDSRFTFSVTPHPDDAGKLIGSRGKMFHSHLTLLRQLAARHGLRNLHYRLATDKTLPARPGKLYVERADWDRALLETTFRECLAALLTLPFVLKSEDAGFKTHYLVGLSAAEPLHVTDLEFMDALSTLWHTTARANGRLVFVEGMDRRAAL